MFSIQLSLSISLVLTFKPSLSASFEGFFLQSLTQSSMMKSFCIFLLALSSISTLKVNLICNFSEFRGDCKLENFTNLIESEKVEINSEKFDVKFLTISNSKMPEEFPTNFDNFFPLLENLRISRTNLRTLKAEGISNLTKLRHFSLDSNKIDFLFPNALETFEELESFFISNNKIEFLHENLFAKNEKLRSVWADYNKIEKLSAKIFENCKNLELLSFAHNQIKKIEINFYDFNKLIFGNFEGNFEGCGAIFDGFLLSEEEISEKFSEFQKKIEENC